ncbi:MAG: AhpC/TSA family protein [Bradyrhizobium sp.]|nr:AhpC/TSA family protein [Bradyrhizobium sp.]
MAAHPSATLERTTRNARILSNLSDLQREHHEVTIDWLRRSGAGDHALQPGDRAPDFLLPDERGRLVSSRELLAKGPLVVAFFCGNWCPFSIAELVDLDLVAGAPRVGRANVVVVTPETARFGLELKQRYNLNMPVLSDIGNVTGFQFGVVAVLPEYVRELFLGLGLNLPMRHGTGEWMVPLPATFVIDPSGSIAGTFVSPDITAVSDPRLVVEQVRRLD